MAMFMIHSRCSKFSWAVFFFFCLLSSDQSLILFSYSKSRVFFPLYKYDDVLSSDRHRQVFCLVIFWPFSGWEKALAMLTAALLKFFKCWNVKVCLLLLEDHYMHYDVDSWISGWGTGEKLGSSQLLPYKNRKIPAKHCPALWTYKYCVYFWQGKIWVHSLPLSAIDFALLYSIELRAGDWKYRFYVWTGMAITIAREGGYGDLREMMTLRNQRSGMSYGKEMARVSRLLSLVFPTSKLIDMLHHISGIPRRWYHNGVPALTVAATVRLDLYRSSLTSQNRLTFPTHQKSRSISEGRSPARWPPVAGCGCITVMRTMMKIAAKRTMMTMSTVRSCLHMST